MPHQPLSDGVRLFYSTGGTGHPSFVPCIASTIPYERTFGEDLRKDHQFFFIDSRGTSRSEGSKASVGSLDTIVDDLEDLRGQLGLDKIAVFGQSRNGMIAAHYAQKYPESLSHVVLIGTPAQLRPPYIFNEDYWETHAEADRKRLFKENQDRMELEGVTVETAEGLVRWFALEGPRLWYDAAFDMTPMWEASLLTPEIGPLTMEGWSAFDVRDALTGTDTPAFLAFGEYDFHCSPTPDIYDAIPTVCVEVFARSGHFPYIEEEKLFADHYREWLNTVEAPQS